MRQSHQEEPSFYWKSLICCLEKNPYLNIPEMKNATFISSKYEKLTFLKFLCPGMIHVIYIIFHCNKCSIKIPTFFQLKFVGLLSVDLNYTMTYVASG